MSLGLALLIFIFASSICVVLVSLVRAPVGVENEEGFVPVRPIDPPRLSHPSRADSEALRALVSRA